MAKYIEREAFIKRLEHEADCSTSLVDVLVINGLANLVRDERLAPTADVVEVVRCKDCKHYDYGRCSEISYIMDGYYQGGFEVKQPTDFCSYGKRKEGAEE